MKQSHIESKARVIVAVVSTVTCYDYERSRYGRSQKLFLSIIVLRMVPVNTTSIVCYSKTVANSTKSHRTASPMES